MKLGFLLLTSATIGVGVCELCQPTALLSAGTPTTQGAAAPVASRDSVMLRIEGMTCAGCTIATRKVLERLEGVSKAEVSYELRRAVVTYDPAKVTVAQMIAAVATLKYTATVLVPNTPPGARTGAPPGAKPQSRS